MSALKKQKGLGRGLDALLGAAPAEREAEAPPASPRAKTTLPIEFLKPNPNQPRRQFNEDALEELAHSIRARGILQPILVRPVGENAYEIVAGERRWRAAQKAQLHEAPVVIRELTDIEAAEIALIENVQRVDLNPVEEARAYKRLVETYKRSHDEIAKAVGKSRSHVANILRLLGLPQFSLNALEAGEISMGHARAILGVEKPDAFCALIKARGLSVREVERLVAETAAEKKSGAKASGDGAARSSAQGKSASGRKDADTRALEADLAAALGLEVAVSHDGKGRGDVSIKFLTLDQLDDICRRLMGAGV